MCVLYHFHRKVLSIGQELFDLLPTLFVYIIYNCGNLLIMRPDSLIFTTLPELLWTAPEHLRDPFPGMKGSEKGDIYSLSIIMQEVILRLPPYGMLEYKTKGTTRWSRWCYIILCTLDHVHTEYVNCVNIAELIQRLRNPPPLIRPKVSPQAAQPQYIVLMKQCWSESPDLRPTIEDIYQQFKSIAGGK